MQLENEIKQIVKNRFVGIVSQWMVILFTVVSLPSAVFLVQHIIANQQRHDAEDVRIVAAMTEIAKAVALNRQGFELRFQEAQRQLVDHEMRIRTIEKIASILRGSKKPR